MKRASESVRLLACCGGMITATGNERATFEVLGAVRDHDAPVHCILSGWESHRIEPMADRIGATWSAGGSYIKFDRHTRSPLALGRQLWDILLTSAHLLREAFRFRPTHVLVPEHVTTIRNLPALLTLRLFGVRVIMRLCNPPDRGRFYRRLWKWAINPVVSHFVCESRFTKDELLACGVAESKTSLISNVPPSRPASQSPVTRKDDVVIFVGQIIPPKGLHVLLEAIAMLRARGVMARLDVVGRIEGWLAPEYGDYWERIKARVAAPDLASSVNLLGWREDVDALMSGASVHCCPSMPEQRESFGLVVLEAKAAGLPSVVFPSGALGEQITHKVDGWVCEEFTATALADGLEHFLVDRARLQRAGEAARVSSKRYDRETFSSSWWRVLAGAASERPFPEHRVSVNAGDAR